ncbi:MAG: class I SAM-dependent methyltransferase [Alphaproteobacteria bacterium]|nr:class I SAM-dependent methyltransferase [Alphaproteobacteria bacterium]
MTNLPGRRMCRFISVFLTAFVLMSAASLSAPAGAQEVTPDVEEISDGLDVPFVPSHADVLKTMFELTKANKDDYVIDLGSGDGRIVIAAVKWLGAQGFGVDLNTKLVDIANKRAQQQGVADRAKFHVRDIFQTDISKASLVTMYLLPDIVLQLRPKLLSTLKPGTRIASHDYHLGDWRPDHMRVVDSQGEERSIVYAWTVPAKVAGKWTWDIAFSSYFNAVTPMQADIEQRYQDLYGKMVVNGAVVPVRAAGVDGTKVSFTVTSEIDDVVVDQTYTGTISGDEITGTVRLSGSVKPVEIPWRARRQPASR